MIFHEMNNVYFLTVAELLRKILESGLTEKEMLDIIRKNAFNESFIQIYQALDEERWQLITRDRKTVIKNPPAGYLTAMEKRWLKAVFNDRRIKLFCDEIPELSDVEPLYKEEDIYLFDKKENGDDYSNTDYIKNFKTILKGITEHRILLISSKNRKGVVTPKAVTPHYLEYSYKDDKFRLLGTMDGMSITLNLSKIESCRLMGEFDVSKVAAKEDRRHKMTMVITDHRNAMERAMLHFSDFEKVTEKLDDTHYSMSIFYEKNDETEVVIRVLSFGPMIKVTAPQSFITLIKKRLERQKNLLGNNN